MFAKERMGMREYRMVIRITKIKLPVLDWLGGYDGSLGPSIY